MSALFIIIESNLNLTNFVALLFTNLRLWVFQLNVLIKAAVRAIRLVAHHAFKFTQNLVSISSVAFTGWCCTLAGRLAKVLSALTDIDPH